MSTTLTKEEFSRTLSNAKYSFLKSIRDWVSISKYGLDRNSKDYKELFVHYYMLSLWEQSGFEHKGYGNVFTEEDVLKAKARINKIK